MGPDRERGRGSVRGSCRREEGERRTPSSGEEGDEDADEGDKNLLTSLVVVANADTGSSNDEVADSHTDGTNEEHRATTCAKGKGQKRRKRRRKGRILTELVDTVETGNGHSDVDDVGGNGDEEGVRNTRVLEEGSAVVEDD